ncbi:MAG: phenylalanine--tRNA ligase subunit beta [Thermoprotei archaeon]|nr:phenylalanine--tRNA ligase subunit beta [TACK group archaeon]
MPSAKINLAKLAENVRASEEDLIEVLPNLKVSVEHRDGDEADVEVTSDRPDLLGQYGLTQAVSSYLSKEEHPLATYREDALVVQDPSTLPFRGNFEAFFVKDLNLDSEDVERLMNFQELLHRAYCRNRELASIGIHDASGINEVTYTTQDVNTLAFTPLGSEKIMPASRILSDTEKGREFSKLLPAGVALVLKSNQGIMSMPPIINSSSTAVREQTKRLFIDVEGRDQKVVRMISALMVRELSWLGKIGTVELQTPDGKRLSPKLESSTMRVNLQDLEGLLGLKLDVLQTQAALRRTGINSVPNRNHLDVLIPYYRFDIFDWTDIAEEIMIGTGLDALAPRLPSGYTVGSKSQISKLTQKARDLMAGLGYLEITSTLLTDGASQSRFYGTIPVNLLNPVSASYDSARLGLMPDLLQALKQNQKKQMPLRFFEVGPVLVPRNNKVDQLLLLAGIISDFSVSIDQVQSDLAALSKDLGFNLKTDPHDFPFAIPGRSGRLQDGWFAEINPAVLLDYGYEFPAVAFELQLSEQFEVEVAD